MPSWEKKLETWQRAGLIGSEQAERIAAFEASQPRRSWVIWGLVGIGATATATGMISLVAANWEAIPAFTKLSAYFVLQAGLGWLFYRRRDEADPLREAWLTLFGAFVLAGIGLIAQIYNLHSEGWQGLLLWLVLVLPLTLLAEGRLLPHVWVLGSGVTACIWAEASSRVLDDGDRWYMVSALPTLFAALGLIPRKWLALPSGSKDAAVTWGFFGLCLGGSLLANFSWVEHGGNDAIAPIALLPQWILGIAGALTVRANEAFPRPQRSALVALFISVPVFVTVPHLISGLPESQSIGALAFLVIWALAGAAAALGGHQRLFDGISIVIAFRFIVVYFEVFGDLTATGIGLILSGAVIIGVALFWHRARTWMAAWLEARR